MAGTLYLCATPIGNLGDMTPRVIETLKEVDIIAAEDTRNSIKLLNHFEIKTSTVSALTFPDIEGSSPIAVTAECPVLRVGDPVAEAVFAYAFGDPVYSFVVGDHLVSYIGHFDKPAVSCIIDKGSVAAPAEGVAVFKGRSAEQQTSFLKILENFLVCILAEGACPRCLGGHLTL